MSYDFDIASSRLFRSYKTNIKFAFPFQDEEIQTGQLKAPAEILLSHHSHVTCDMRPSGMLYSTYLGCHAAAFCME